MRSGQRIPTVIEPGEALQVLSRTQAAMIITLANAILQGKIVRGTKDGIAIADENVVFELKEGETASSDSENHPFEILQPNAGTANFRDIQVNAGNLFAYPSPEAVAIEFAGAHISAFVPNFNTTITLPASAAVVVYIDVGGGSGGGVVATDTDDTTWVQFGSNDNNHFVIGFIDALTNAASQQLIVHQYVSADTIWPISGSFQGVEYPSAMVFHGGWTNIVTYVARSSVVYGEIVTGFPADGLYLYTGSSTGVGPGNDFIRF